MGLWPESLCVSSGYTAMKWCKVDYPYSLWPLCHCKQKGAAMARRLVLVFIWQVSVFI